MVGRPEIGALGVGRLRDVVRTELAATYSEMGLEQTIASTLAANGRVNRGVIVYSIGSAGSDEAEVLSLAVSSELMHRASVILDDIEDSDTVRRGRPCFHVVVGQSRALATADLLLSSALMRFGALGSLYLKEAIETYADMARGQALDVRALSRSINVDEPAKLKTGSLIRMCFRFGARAAGLPDDVVSVYGEIGMHLGCVFQLQNDINNFLGDEVRSSELQSDLAHGNLSSIAVAIELGSMSGEYSPVDGVANVKARRDAHLAEFQMIMGDGTIEMPASLRFVIGDLARASEFVGDQAASAGET